NCEYAPPPEKPNKPQATDHPTSHLKPATSYDVVIQSGVHLTKRPKANTNLHAAQKERQKTQARHATRKQWTPAARKDILTTSNKFQALGQGEESVNNATNGATTREFDGTNIVDIATTINGKTTQEANEETVRPASKEENSSGQELSMAEMEKRREKRALKQERKL
ncbi:hypothetical protein GIB67_007473, partial [Kingdonia uniflora]